MFVVLLGLCLVAPRQRERLQALLSPVGLRLLLPLRQRGVRLVPTRAGPRRLVHLDRQERIALPGPAGAFAQEVTVLPLHVANSEDEIRHEMSIGTCIFNENLNIRLFQPYLWVKCPCISSKNSWSQNGRFLSHWQPNSLFW